MDAYVGQRTDGSSPGGHSGDPTINRPSLPMSNATAAHRHRATLHVLRDRVERALRDEKRGIPGASERVAAHRAKRAAYRASPAPLLTTPISRGKA